MNETIPSEDINYIPYQELFPNTVIGGVEVDDNISSPTKTWSSEKINTELEDLSDEINNIDLSGYQVTSAKDTAGGYLGANANSKLDADKVDYLTTERIFDDFIVVDNNFNSNGYNAVWQRVGTTVTTVTMTTVTDALSGFTDKSKNIMRVGINNSVNAVGTLYTILSKHLGNTNIIEVEVLLSSYSNNGELWLGFGKLYPSTYNQTDAALSQAIYFKFKSSENASFTTNTVISGTNTQVDSTIDKVAATPYKLKIKVNKNTNNIYFYINDTLIDTRLVSATFLQPVSSSDTPFNYFFISQTGDNTTTNRFILVDYVDIIDKKTSR